MSRTQKLVCGIFAVIAFGGAGLYGCSQACVRNSDCASAFVCMEGECAAPAMDGGDVFIDADTPDDDDADVEDDGGLTEDESESESDPEA